MKLTCRILSLYAAASLVTVAAAAQQRGAIDAGVHFIYDYANLTPLSSGLIGAGAHVELSVVPHLRAVAKVDFVENNGIRPQYVLGPASGSLRQTSFTVGGRYFPLRPLLRLQPYAEAMLGDLYSSGTLAPSNSTGAVGPNQLVVQTGGGLLFRFSHRLAVMPAELDYVHTSNSAGTGVVGRLRLSTGIVLRVRHFDRE